MKDAEKVDATLRSTRAFMIQLDKLVVRAFREAPLALGDGPRVIEPLVAGAAERDERNVQDEAAAEATLGYSRAPRPSIIGSIASRGPVAGGGAILAGS